MNFFKKLFSKPVVRILTVTSSNGFHLRPIAQFVNTAKHYDTEINATFQSKTVNAKAVNTLLSLNLEKGDSFKLIAKGSQAVEALDSLEKCFFELMHNDKEIIPSEQKPHNYQSNILHAKSITAGIAIAPLYTLSQQEKYKESHHSFQEAIFLAKEELENLYISTKDKNRNIYLAQKELLSSLVEDIDTLEAFEHRIQKESQALEGGILESKRVDYLDILQRVKHHLGYNNVIKLPNTPSILIADDLLPSDILLLEKSQIQGVILKNTTPTSHTAILLRASGIPSIILKQSLSNTKTSVILDADAGVLLLKPIEEDISKAQTQQNKNQLHKQEAYEKRLEPACTKVGKQIQILANVSDIVSAKLAKKEGAEGIGLLRTEFLFDTVKPTVEEQQKAYEEIFTLFTDITVRTLDVGGDKALPYVKLPHEDNPFLGIRGVRLFKTHPQLLEEQILAIFRAAQTSKNIKIMFPMIATIEDFVEAKAFAYNVADKYKLNISHILFGMMIEVPSTLFLIPEFNKIVDFYSIGTNDLTQYLFAIERTHPTLSTDTLSPVIFSALEKILKESTKPVSICGELASEPKAIEKLISLGLEKFSMSAKNISEIKEIVRHT